MTYAIKNPLDLRYNYWGQDTAMEHLYRASCIPIITLPYLTSPSFDSELGYEGYNDPQVPNAVVSESVFFPFGIVVYDTSFTILPGTTVDVSECGITLRGNFTFNAIGNATHRIKIRSYMDATVEIPLISATGPLRLEYVDLLSLGKRSRMIELNTTLDSSYHFEEMYLNTRKDNMGHSIYLNTQANTTITIRGTVFSGNSAISITHQGSLLIDRSKMIMEHITETAAVALSYTGANLTISGSTIITNSIALEIKADSVFLLGNSFVTDVRSLHVKRDIFTVRVIASEIYLFQNSFIDLDTEIILRIESPTRRCDLYSNYFSGSNNWISSMIEIISPSTRIVGRNNTIENNNVDVSMTVLESDNSVAFLDWTYNAFRNNSVMKEIVSTIPSDVRYNYWGTNDLRNISLGVQILSYTINPFLNDAPWVPGVQTTDCVAIYGNRVDSNCRFGICNYLNGFLTEACGGHGTCNLNGTCTCERGYYGPRCTEFSCFNKSSTASGVCNHGICVSPDKCECKLLQSGNNCQYYSCDGIVESNSTVCSGNGRCVASNVCNCTNGYYGMNCDMWTCNNITRVRTDGCPDGCLFVGDKGCSNRGTCIGYNTCSCRFGYYGSTCEYYNCFGERYDSPNVCSGFGVCKDVGICQCKEKYSGPDCSLVECFSKTGANACGNGKCVSPDLCKCNVGYTGVECDLPICNGLNSNQSGVCNDRGTCIKPDYCLCNPTAEGQFCEICKPGHSGKTCSEDTKDSFDIDVAIGVTVGISSFFAILATLVAVPFIVLYCKKRRKQQAQEIELKLLLSERLVAEEGEGSVNEEWIIDRDDIAFEERISEGAFGIVFKGMYKRKMPIAIKKLKIEDDRGEFESEVKILKSLRHPVSSCFNR